MGLIYYKPGYMYQLKKDYSLFVKVYPTKAIQAEFMSLTPEGKLTIKSGYAWDGPSFPALHTDNFMRGSLVHDALYQLMRRGSIPASERKVADQELHRICSEDGMSWFRAKYVYLAVRLFGGSSINPPEERILTAP